MTMPHMTNDHTRRSGIRARCVNGAPGTVDAMALTTAEFWQHASQQSHRNDRGSQGDSNCVLACTFMPGWAPAVL